MIEIKLIRNLKEQIAAENTPVSSNILPINNHPTIAIILLFYKSVLYPHSLELSRNMRLGKN